MSITSQCPHCKSPFQAPDGVSEVTCPHCQKLVKVNAGEKVLVEKGDEKKTKVSQETQFLDPEELKKTPFPVEQLAKEKGFKEAFLQPDPFADFEGSFGYVEDEVLANFQDKMQEPVPDYQIPPIEEEVVEKPHTNGPQKPQEGKLENYPSREATWDNTAIESDPGESTPAPRAGVTPQSPLRKPQKPAAGPVTFDPSKPEEYLQSLARLGILDESIQSCMAESLHTYRSGCYRAAAVLLGVAIERIFLDLRQTFVTCFRNLNKDFSWDQSGKARIFWRQMAQTLYSQLITGARKYPNRGKEWNRLARALDARVDAFSYLLRFGRDESYRPANFEFITPGEVHAALALMPHVAELISQLRNWMTKYLLPVVNPSPTPVKK